MKVTMHVCDICHYHQPDAKIKYKYRAKKAWYLWGRSWREHGWKKMELCQDCLDMIIEAETRIKNKK